MGDVTSSMMLWQCHSDGYRDIMMSYWQCHHIETSWQVGKFLALNTSDSFDTQSPPVDVDRTLKMLPNFSKLMSIKHNHHQTVRLSNIS